MKRFLSLFALALVACILTVASPRAGFAQQTTKTVSTTAAGTSSSSGAPVDVARIISAVAAKESEFRQALANYAFTRDVTIQSIGLGGEAKGEYRRVSSFVFDDKGARYEKITFFPLPTLNDLMISQDDLEDLGGIQPFALEASKIDQYNFTYVGKERIDELDLYVFDVAPKVMPDPKKTRERVFQGRIWVDDKDLQIVKVRGKAMPETKNARFPTFETYREQVDGRYWFPTYTYADDDLEFKNGTIHIRMSVRYKDYKKFGSTVIIKDVDPDEKDPQ